MQGYPGQIHANIGPIKTNVPFNHSDGGVTLLKNDHVLINLVYDIVTRKRRAANIKPKVPFTFSYTKEKRDLVTHLSSSSLVSPLDSLCSLSIWVSVFQGVITCLGAEEGIVSSAEHGELPFNTCENFSDTEFNSSDIRQEVEFTVAMVSWMS